MPSHPLRRLILFLVAIFLAPTSLVHSAPSPGNVETLDYIESAGIEVIEVWVQEEKGSGFQKYLLEEPSWIKLVPASDDVADLLVELGLSPAVYSRVRMVIQSGSVELTEAARVTDDHTFSTHLRNLSFPRGFQSGDQMTVEPPVQVVTVLSDELNLDLDLTRSFVFNGSPVHDPGVKQVVFKPVIRGANTSTHGRITVRVVHGNDSGMCLANTELIPFEGATVTAIDLSGANPPVSTSTDAAGDAWLPLFPGTYDVVVSGAVEPGGGTGDPVPVIPVRLENIEVFLANETALGDVTLEQTLTQSTFDQDTATLLAIMMNIAYADGRGGFSGGLAKQEKGQSLVRPNSSYANGLKTELADYLDPCWQFYYYLPVELTQFFIANNVDNGDIVVSFAGTADAIDFLTDVNIQKVPWTLRDETGQFRTGETIESVSNGVRIAYLAVADILQEKLASLIEETNPNSRSRVYFTGHSLGGGLATLAALDMADYLVKQHGYNRNNVVMYGFGGPRVMTQNLAPTFLSIVPNGHAVAAKDDIVPHLLGDDVGLGDNYSHIRKLVVLSSNISNSADDGDERYVGLGATRVEHSNGLPYTGCLILGAPSAGVSVFAYGKKGHDQLQYIKRIENIVAPGIPELSVFIDATGPLGGDRLWLRWEGGVQGPCDWVRLFETDKDDPAPTEVPLIVGLNWQWVVKGAGYPNGVSTYETFKNPNGLIDQGKDFWIGYMDGFDRIIRTKRFTGHRDAGGLIGGDLQSSGGVSFSPPSPNPSATTMTLRYAMPEAAPVRLSIYDVAGRLVRTLNSGLQAAGEHVEQWNLRDASGRAVSAGIYFLRLDMGERALVQKVIVTR